MTDICIQGQLSSVLNILANKVTVHVKRMGMMHYDVCCSAQYHSIFVNYVCQEYTQCCSTLQSWLITRESGRLPVSEEWFI